MTNWTAFPATGTRVTTWNYNPSRGWLGSKTYDGGAAGPSYQYTPAGRLHSALGPQHHHHVHYDNAGGLATVGYSDGTPPGVSYTYDRRGRPATVTQNGIQNTLSYNDANLLLSEAYSGGLLANLSVTSGYDQYLRRTSLTLNSHLNPQLRLVRLRQRLPPPNRDRQHHEHAIFRHVQLSCQLPPGEQHCL